MNKLALSFDVEDWFTVANMGDHFPPEKWDQCELRIRHGMDFILEELKKRNVRATFFILGWIAERCPELVKDIAAEGHEVASHGYHHQRLTQLTPESFESDLKLSLEILSDLANRNIRGYRAPSFSITTKTLWALKVLRENGLEYDSSIYPTRHPDYGIPGHSKDVHELEGLVEVPMTSLEMGSMQVPISGGGYFRLYPYRMTKTFLRRALKKRPVITYFHPWEFDPEQPRLDLGRTKTFRHYVGLSKNRRKFQRFLDDFSFSTMGEVVDDYLRHGAVRTKTL